MDTMMMDKKRTRREHSKELKARILAECSVPGASVAQVAMAYGINANLVHVWRKQARELREAVATTVQTHSPVAQPPLCPAPFVPVAVVQAQDASIQIELHRGAAVMKVNWPLSAAARCAAWARELLK